MSDAARDGGQAESARPDDDLDPGPPPGQVRDLVRAVAADPTYLAERLTLHTLKWWGPRAHRSLQTLRRQNPNADLEQLRQAVVRRTVRTCMVEGSFLGGPFVLLLPVAFCSALLTQIRMILEFAALSGRTPTDPVRAAEVLVIQGVHPDIPTAQAALRTADARRPRREGDQVGLKALGRAAWRMARLLGILTPESPQDQPGKSRQLANWLALGGTFLIGTIIPLIWMPYLALGYRRGTLDLAQRTETAYSGTGGKIRPPASTGRAVPVMTGALARALGGILATVALSVALVILNLTLVGNRWSTTGIVLVVVGAVTSGIWYLRRRRRQHR